MEKPFYKNPEILFISFFFLIILIVPYFFILFGLESERERFLVSIFWSPLFLVLFLLTVFQKRIFKKVYLRHEGICLVSNKEKLIKWNEITSIIPSVFMARFRYIRILYGKQATNIHINEKIIDQMIFLCTSAKNKQSLIHIRESSLKDLSHRVTKK